MTSTKAPPSAEFMQVWDEGYISTPASFAMRHTQAVIVLDGAALRSPDGTIDRTAVRAHIEAATAELPQTRLRLMRSPLGLTPPAWVIDASFDIDAHVVFADAALPLSDATLWDLSGRARGILSQKRPLWRFTVTELDDGDVALGVVMHHVTGDGLFTLKILSALTSKQAEPLRARVAASASARAPRNGAELVWVALRQWTSRQNGLRNAWQDYWSKPVVRRMRRVAGRILRPLRARRAADPDAQLTPRHSAFRTVDAAAVSHRASALGGTMSDLFITAVVRAAGEIAPTVGLRVPLVVRRKDDVSARNSVVDVQISARCADDAASVMTSVHEQLQQKRDHLGETTEVPMPTIGYATLIPWLSRPRYLGPARVKEIIAFPTGLDTDRLSSQAILYDEKVTIVATAAQSDDVTAIAERIAQELTADEQNPAGAEETTFTSAGA